MRHGAIQVRYFPRPNGLFQATAGTSAPVRAGGTLPGLQRLLVTVLTLCTTVASALAQTRPEYTIREDAPRTGSLIRKAAVGPAAVPVNLPYEQMTAEDRAKFNENYEQIPAGDEPPFPRHGLREVFDPIRKAQGRLLVRGDLFLVATIDPSGEAVEVTVIGSPSPEMTRFAAEILLLTKYKPAMCGGKPCTMQFPLRMRFNVE